ncbi:MAG: PspC domain-containing protein, partial [Mycobacteriaceae bacterium]
MTTSGASGIDPSGGTGTSGGASGTQLLREIWDNRPCRFPDDGPVGGVCIGLARRYEIDPVLVRVAFGVATLLGGAGIPVYLACWLFLPAAGDAVSGGEALLGRGGASFSSGGGPRSSGPRSSGPRSSMARRTAIVLIVLLALSAVGQIGPGKGVLFSGGVAGLVLLGAGLYLLHQRRPRRTSSDTAAAVSLDKA